ncbi:MAG: uracil-DNA glycosylase [Deltaproteobacteria bacterium]|nr:uracil-DNA glycosylase [Deltaproteobacteria bacterium]
MRQESISANINRRGYQAQLREIVVGLRHYLEEEKSLGLDGWAHSTASTMKNAPFQPGVPKTSFPADMEAVRAELGDCRRCKLHAYRTQIVFGTGNPQAKLVFVGEAPGRDEDIQGQPFVGQAGQLLTKIIEAIQLSREDVYIGNIIKCRPPNNRNPEPDEISACEPFLVKQLQVIRPKLICALGTFAAHTLLETDEKISDLRGKFHKYQGIPLMPTYHPAYLLRNQSRKREVWEDLKKIKKEYEKL